MDNHPIDIHPSIWGPPYWKMLHMIAHQYPVSPNDVIKKKYYNFIQSLPFFIPHQESSTVFEQLLTTYPVAAYLSSNESLIKWMHFIHNQVNIHTHSRSITLDAHEKEYQLFIDYAHRQPSTSAWLYKVFPLSAILLILGSMMYTLT